MSIAPGQVVDEERQSAHTPDQLGTQTLFNREFREKVDEVDSHWKSSMIIRIAILILVITNGIVIAIDPLTTLYLWPSCAGIVVSGAWTLTVIVFRVLVVKPIHPAVHVSWELAIWLGLITVFSMATVTVSNFTPQSFYFYDGYEGYDGYSIPNAGTWGVDVFGVTILAVLMILHFYLFVRACIETSRRRSKDIATQAAVIAAQMVKNMESRGTFFRRNSDVSYGYTPFESGASGHIIGLENLRSNQNTETGPASSFNNNHSQGYAGFAPMESSRFSQISYARSGRTVFSQARTQYSRARSLSVPVPTSPRSLRTALTDEPSFFRLEV